MGMILALTLWVGRWLTLGQWPTPGKEWIASGVAAVLATYSMIWGQRDYRVYAVLARRSPVALTAGQALLVVLIVVAFGCFGTWLCWY